MHKARQNTIKTLINLREAKLFELPIHPLWVSKQQFLNLKKGVSSQQKSRKGRKGKREEKKGKVGKG